MEQNVQFFAIDVMNYADSWMCYLILAEACQFASVTESVTKSGSNQAVGIENG